MYFRKTSTQNVGTLLIDNHTVVFTGWAACCVAKPHWDQAKFSVWVAAGTNQKASSIAGAAALLYSRREAVVQSAVGVRGRKIVESAM